MSSHFSHGQLSPIATKGSTKVNQHEVFSWFASQNTFFQNSNPDPLPEFRMKDNLFTL